MIHRPITNENIETYTALMRQHSEYDATSFNAYSENGVIQPCANRSCYASVPVSFAHGDDHLAVLYNGYNQPVYNWADVGNCPSSQMNNLPKAYGRSATQWLEFLLSRQSPFSALFPFLVYSSIPEIISRRGFIFHNLTEGANLDLLLMFISVARMASENPRTFQHYFQLRYIRKIPMNIAALIGLTMAPEDYKNERQWSEKLWNHGNAFGHRGHFGYARRFLHADPLPHRPELSMSGCQNVFGLPSRNPTAPASLITHVSNLRLIQDETVPAAA